MPAYDYFCKGCENQFEQVLPMARREEPTNDPCPECGHLTVIKMITGTTNIDIVKVKGRSLMDSGVRDRLDKMSTLYPNMKRTIGV